MTDYKDWIRNRADTLSLEQYGMDYYDLNSSLQNEIYQHAMDDYKDHYADMIDHIYETIRDRQMG